MPTTDWKVCFQVALATSFNLGFQALSEPGQGRVLVVDGGGSLRCALLGDQIAAMGVKNGWSGILINGCIRDSEDIGQMPLGVKALATCPLKVWVVAVQRVRAIWWSIATREQPNAEDECVG
eukprot:363357-Chlamydomonas_euryale.AAC.10